ncbi:hypothetical protein CYLTODRAFT_385358 [Cylindrobasidium torrendii FP15055 ss-10]|uniref:C2H2-type domain-containing protein n=1 Tax=Cylindrobasidium torrendii FP15055 ss-10 TaxID=1314674 RepID=A0A0D7BXS5_9AGAR|nr:hypothetical protein CYLTODRAFT_385358 [Cylindrobasidium torrendii FP15055 ss-10]
MASTATTSKASDTDFRKKWDKEEYAEKARQRDAEERERMQENDARMKQGKRPRKNANTKDMPKPTETMKAREGPLDLDKNLNKTMVVQNTSNRGSGQPGFYCDTCERNYRDTTSYLDHINSRSHLRAIGQTTKLEKSTVDQVRARIALLRERTKDKVSAQQYDFDQRLEEIRNKEKAIRDERKAEKKAAKERARLELVQDAGGEDTEMMSMMGFGGFGSTKK